jgi:hypothetical protein
MALLERDLPTPRRLPSGELPVGFPCRPRLLEEVHGAHAWTAESHAPTLPVRDHPARPYLLYAPSARSPRKALSAVRYRYLYLHQSLSMERTETSIVLLGTRAGSILLPRHDRSCSMTAMSSWSNLVMLAKRLLTSM